MTVSRKEISAILKANGIKPSYVGSRLNKYSMGRSYNFTIKHYSVSASLIKSLFKHLINPINTFVFVDVFMDHKDFYKGAENHNIEEFDKTLEEMENATEKEFTLVAGDMEKSIVIIKDIAGEFTFDYIAADGYSEFYNIKLRYYYREYDNGKSSILKAFFNLIH